MACTKQITVSIENLLWYNRRNKIGHDNSVKKNTYLSYYKWHRYWHAFRQRAPQQTIDVDLISWTGGSASFVVPSWISYTLDDLPLWTEILESNGRYLLRYEESTIWEIVSTASAPYIFDSVSITRWQSTIQIGSTPVALENWDELNAEFVVAPDYLCFTANTNWSTVQLTRFRGSPTAVSLEICINWWLWEPYSIWQTVTLTNIWDRVYFRNTSTTDTRFSKWYRDCYRFVMSWSIAWSWDTNYLLNKNSTTTTSQGCFAYLFFWCHSLTTAPKLPATTLDSYCYEYMFSNCSNLTTLTALPATALTVYCYAYMFQNCSNIKLSTTRTWDYQTAYRVPTTWTWATQTGSCDDMFAGTWWTFTWTPSINTTYYTSNTIVS